MMLSARNSNAPDTTRELGAPVWYGAGLKRVTGNTDNRRPVFDQCIHPMAKLEGDQAAFLSFPRAFDEWLDDVRPRAPGDLKARYRIAVTDGHVAAALGPAHDWKPAHAAVVEPVTFFAGREIHVGLSPLAWPVIFLEVKPCGAHPVLQRKISAIANAHAPLLRTVDKEQPAE